MMLEDEFRAARSRSIERGGLVISLYDRIPLEGCRRVIVEFAANPRDYRQGIWMGDMSRDSGLTLRTAGVEWKSFSLWTDTSPPRVEIEIEAPLDRLVVYNIWEDRGHSFSQLRHSGMLVGVSPDGKQRDYRCNSMDPEERFEDLAFRLTLG